MTTTRTLVLEDIRGRSLEEILWDVVKESVRIIVRMPGGEQVVIEPKPRLWPLPALEGDVPEGWKDAVYADGR